MHLTLVTGGARSGKSRHALSLAVEAGAPVTFVATAEPHDQEMAERIVRHRGERPSTWRTIEAPRAAAAALREADTAVVVVDCLTLLVSNLLLASGEDPDRAGAAVAEELEALLGGRAERDGALIVVSNEVGLGVVPATPLGRLFRDLLGDANQRVAGAADEVVFMVSGIPLPVRAPRFR